METKGKRTEEAKAKDTTQQQGCSPVDICRKLKDIEKKIDSSSDAQISMFTFAVGIALVFFGLSYWPRLLEHLGIDVTNFYFVNPVAFIFLGFTAIFYAFISHRTKKKKLKEEHNGN